MPLYIDTIIESDYKFSQTNRFSTEDSYQSYLTNLLSTELDTIVHREYRCKTGRLDIYIPIVNAIIECKLDKSRACQAQRQLDRYNQCFNSDALFIAIANSDDENYILSKLKPLVSKRKKEFDLKSKKMLSWLKIVDIFIYDTIEAENKVKSIHASIKNLLDEAELFIKKNSKLELIEKQLSRIEKDWFRYQYIHGLFKPKCILQPCVHEYWQHPNCPNLFLVKYFTSYSDLTKDGSGSTAFYNLTTGEFYLHDYCGRSSNFGIDTRYEMRKLSCQGLPCNFIGAFNIDSAKRIKPGEQTIEYIHCYNLENERLKIAWLLHPETKLHHSYYTETPRKHGLFAYMENKAISSIIRKCLQANNKRKSTFYEPWNFEVYSGYWFCYELADMHINDIYKQECFNLIEDQLSPISREYLKLISQSQC